MNNYFNLIEILFKFHLLTQSCLPVFNIQTPLLVVSEMMTCMISTSLSLYKNHIYTGCQWHGVTSMFQSVHLIVDSDDQSLQNLVR